MDELDRENSTSKAVMAATVLAGAAALVALGVTRERKQQKPAIAAEASAAVDKVVETTKASTNHFADNLADLAPDVMDALDQHAPDISRRIRQAAPMLQLAKNSAGAANKPAIDKLINAINAAGATASKVDPKKTLEAARASIVAAVDDHSDDLPTIDLDKLTPAQNAAAQAVVAAVAKAEKALSTGASLADEARSRTNERVEDYGPMVRDVARQAVDTMVTRWEQARAKAVDASPRVDLHAATDLASERLHDAAGKAKEASDHAADALHLSREKTREATEDAKGKAVELVDTAKASTKAAAEKTVDTSKETGAMLGWLAAAAGIVFYVLMDEERRERFSRFTEEVSFQVRELVRDFRGYDDEF